MFPVLIRIGPLTVHSYGFLIAVAFLVALGLANRQASKVGLPREQMTDLGFYTLIAAILGSRIFFIFTDLSHFLSHPLDMFKIWEGGLVFYGGIIFAVPTAVWYAKKTSMPVWQTADIWAPSIAIGHAIGRLGCFCAGCCYGKPAEGIPWAVVFTNPESLAVKGVPLHPSQIYESLAEFTNFLVLISFRRYQTFKGQLFCLYLINYSIIRSVVELFRGDEARGFIFSGFSISQGISVALFVSAAVMMVWLKRRNKDINSN